MTAQEIKTKNEEIARNYIYELAKKLNETLYHIKWSNQSKDPQNHFQFVGYLESGNCIWATFIYVNDNGKVIKTRSNIELVNEEFETIKKI